MFSLLTVSYSFFLSWRFSLFSKRRNAQRPGQEVGGFWSGGVVEPYTEQAQEALQHMDSPEGLH